MNFIEDFVIPVIEKYTEGTIDTLTVIFQNVEIEKVENGIYKKLMTNFDKNIDKISLFYMSPEDNVKFKKPYKEQIKATYSKLLAEKIGIL